MNREYCVISHTHWDREWYLPFEEHRIKLIDLMDGLFRIIDEFPEYIFHLDAQTIILEDYLEAKPSRRSILKNHIRNGNIIIGPWYLQNDFYLTSGEATIRNLLIGRKIANEYGACSNAGYAPDQFGNISQLPQILNNFGIDNFIFGRGRNKQRVDSKEGEHHSNNSEFVWCGADNSKLLAIHMIHWYNNAQRFSANIENSLYLLELIKNSFDGIATTPYLLLMNGVDHLEPQENLIPIINTLNEKLENGYHIEQTTMDDYIKSVKNHIQNNEIQLQEIKGELRYGPNYEILNGTLSSRPYLKILNTKAQTMIEQELEPLYTMLELSGMKDFCDREALEFLWKQLLKNHPHDSICGCSRDEVHSDMENRYARIFQTIGSYKKKALEQSIFHCDKCYIGDDDYVIVIANTLSKAMSGYVTVTLEIESDDNIQNFKLVNDNGDVDFEVLSADDTIYNIVSPINLPGQLNTKRYLVRVKCVELEPYSFNFYGVLKDEGVKKINDSINEKNNVIENKFIKLEAFDNGKVLFTNKESGESIENVIYFEDTHDVGDVYVSLSNYSTKISSLDLIPKINTSMTKFTQEIVLTYNFNLPETYDFINKCRSAESVDEMVELRLVITDEEKVEVKYSIDNKAKFHKLRLLFSTGIATFISNSEIPFDIVHKNKVMLAGGATAIHPNNGLVFLEHEQKGFAVFTNGNMDYEHLEEEKALAFTLVRSTCTISPVNDGKGSGDIWMCPQNQLIRNISGNIAFKCYCNKNATELIREAQSFRGGVIGISQNRNPEKFGSGNPCVQDTKISEIFFREDKYKKVKLQKSTPIIKVEGDIIVSSLKPAFDNGGYVLRIWNCMDEAKEAAISIPDQYELFYSDMAEKTYEKACSKIILDSKKIITLLIKLI